MRLEVARPSWRTHTWGYAIEAAFAGDYDGANSEAAAAAHDGLRAPVAPVALAASSRQRAEPARGATPTPSTTRALSRPWAAWLVLVAGAGALYATFKAPQCCGSRSSCWMAWLRGMLRLLPADFLSGIGRWAWLSAGFYLLDMLLNLLISDDFTYRYALLGMDLLMIALLLWLLRSAHQDAALAEAPRRHRPARLLCLGAAALLAAATLSNVLGNVSLATMLTEAVLDSTYIAVALFASGIVLAAMFPAYWMSGPTFSRITSLHTDSVIRAGSKLGRTALVVAWAIFSLEALRVYRPVAERLVSLLSHQFKLGVVSVSLGNILAFVAAVWLAFWLARMLRSLLADDVLPSLSLPRGVGNSISTLTYSSTVLLLGLLIALAVAGFKVGQLAIVFGALGVGIGFGLQDVVKNFVAGLILMFERPIQPGDTVDVAGMQGIVRDIGMRATVLTTFDGAEVIVPNGMLLADKLVNWTLRGDRRRIDINVVTSYDAAPRTTIDLLVAAASGLRGIAPRPEPVAIVTGLGRGTVELNLRAWPTAAADWIVGRSDLAIVVRESPRRGRDRGVLGSQSELHPARRVRPGGESPGRTERRPGRRPCTRIRSGPLEPRAALRNRRRIGQVLLSKRGGARSPSRTALAAQGQQRHHSPTATCSLPSFAALAIAA